MSDPADLINRAIEALHAAAIDLPAFSTLDRLVNRLRAEVHGRIYDRVAARLTAEHAAALDALLAKPPNSATTSFNRLKQAPGPATPKTIRLWIDRLDWLTGLIDPDPLLEGIAHTKLRQFAAEAAALEVSDLLDISQPGKRHTLLLALLRQARMRCRDELIEMMLRRIRRTQAAAKEQLEALHDQHRGIEEALIGIFGQVLETAQAQETDAAFGRQVRKLLAEQGGVEALAEQCETVSAWHRDNDLPLLWPIHARHRSLLFRLLDLLDIRSATQDRSLLDALAVVSKHRHARRDEVLDDVDLGFASQRWQSFVVKRRSGTWRSRPARARSLRLRPSGRRPADRRSLRRRRRELRRLPRPAPALGRMRDAAAGLLRRSRHPRTRRGFRRRAEGRTDGARRRGRCRLPGQHRIEHRCRRNAASEAAGDDGASPTGLAEFEQEIRARMPERHLLDILKHAEHWARYTRHFGPPSGSDPKLAQAVQRYLFTVFGYGCNLGPSQTARHAPEIATAQALRRINAQHINADKLEAAMVDVIDQYARFPLPRHWGSGRAAIADGTHVKLRENNLLGSRHIRYGGYGGIAYHHIADTYIALFTSFIPCGVWEAVHILDGLLKNRLGDPARHAACRHPRPKRAGLRPVPTARHQADAAHARLERRRSSIARPSRSATEHIDALFAGEIDWDLIATHARDMIQVVLSIQAGRVMPSMLLRKLGTYNRRSLLYRAFRELGRVERTLFLLRFISSAEVRRTIRAETTKIEAYNDFLDWISFGGPVIKSGDPVEQEKQLKYASLVANTIMLSNVADMTDVLSAMAAGRTPRHARPGRLPQPLYARAHPPLRPIRPRHGRPAGPARSATAPLRAGLVTTFYTYPEPTPAMASSGAAPGDPMPSLLHCGRSCVCSPIVDPSHKRWRAGTICRCTEAKSY